jgi:hypothetical protein
MFLERGAAALWGAAACCRFPIVLGSALEKGRQGVALQGGAFAPLKSGIDAFHT